MKHKLLLRTIVCGMAVSLLAGSAIARQSSPGAGSDPNASGTGTYSQQPLAPSSSATLSPTSMRPRSERLSQLMGSTVKDQQGNTLGQINDFVVNPASGRIQFAVISLNDQAGKLTAVPWQLVKPGADPTTSTLAASKDKLDSAMTFDASSWPDFSQPSTHQQIYAHFGVQPSHMGGAEPGAGNESGTGSSGYDQTKPDNSGSPGAGGTSGSGTGTNPKLH
ncbi:MAG: photosystem reaction center subunit [Pedosphaera sp.]|nr:photosystem reaction center subunit [Pedosphaera sp.]